MIVAAQLPDYALFESLPGAGAQFAPRLIAEVRGNSSGDRAQREEELGSLALQCPKFLRQTFVEWAGQTASRSFCAGAYCQQQRAKCNSHHVALRALAFMWIRILYRCWQTRTPYDEAVYLNALRKRGSRLPGSLTLSG